LVNGHVADLAGNALDGEFPGMGANITGFPSGNGSPTGDFVATFDLTLPATQNLIAWYKFDDGQGTTAAASSGNNHPGTLNNGPVWSPGIVGSGSLYFDGADDFVKLGMPDQPVPWTAAVWVKRQPATLDSAAILYHAATRS